MRRRAAQRRWWGPALLVMAVIWWLSSQSDTPGPPLRHPLDWVAHALSYLALAYSLGRATGRRGTALLIAVWFGALDEVHQAFVPGRDAGIGDWLFDLLGALIGSRLATRARPTPEERSPDAVLSEPGA
ncbi:VanZ family protein [Deinococcus hohokamensis]|uniref:VanZ family protein n=1 Tax=Deinococcus hohokamensis TaxID=309883 RepID=A0ABV9I6P0_9DEIO